MRVAGKWLFPERLDGRSGPIPGPWPDCGEVWAVPNRRGAEALRLHLIFRRLSPRQATETWLVGHAWFGKGPTPKLWGWLYNRLPEHRKWRRALIEVELPKQVPWSAPGYEPHEPPHNPAS